MWSPPRFPNGIISGYRLFRNGQPISKYAGVRNFNDSGPLGVYTDYTYQVEACTQVGCSKSAEVILRTGQLPPAFVAAPDLAVLGKLRALVGPVSAHTAFSVLPEQTAGESKCRGCSRCS